MILTIIGLVGISIIITSSPLLKKIREKILSKSEAFYNFSTCALCIGFILGSIVKLDLIFGGVVGISAYIIDLILTHIELDIFIRGGIKPPRDKKLQ
jgi:hypothetical protein